MTSPTSALSFDSHSPQTISDLDASGPSQPPTTFLHMAALDELRELTEDADGMFAQLIDNYLSSTSSLLAQLPDAAVQGDAPTAQMAAHDIKSMSAMFGAMHLSELARQLEHNCANQIVSGMAELVAQLLAEFDQVSAALKTLATQPQE